MKTLSTRISESFQVNERKYTLAQLKSGKKVNFADVLDSLEGDAELLAHFKENDGSEVKYWSLKDSLFISKEKDGEVFGFGYEGSVDSNKALIDILVQNKKNLVK